MVDLYLFHKNQDFTNFEHSIFPSKGNASEDIRRQIFSALHISEEGKPLSEPSKIDSFLEKHYSKEDTPSILGSEEFVKWIKDSFSKKKKEKEIPESKKLCPEIIDIKKAICNHYHIEDEDLLKSRRGIENEARDLGIYMSRIIRGELLETIGQEFNLNNYSSVSTAIERIRKKLESNKFKRHYEQILNSI